MGKAGSKLSTEPPPRRRGRRFKAPYLVRLAWVTKADQAKGFALKRARLEHLPRKERADFDKQPQALQDMIESAVGRHSRYLDAAALQSAGTMLQKIRKAQRRQHGIRIDQPSYLRGLWRDIDRWIANQLGVSLRTFRSWRPRLVRSEDLRKRQRRSMARRKSGRCLSDRAAA